MPRTVRSVAAVCLAGLGLSAVVGCQATNYVDKQKVDQTPMVVDEAMQQRQWEPVTAAYQSGKTFSGSTGFAYSPNHDASPYTYVGTDFFTYLLNTVTLPYTLYKQRDGVASGGVQIPPSYTAIPPQEPTTQPVPKFFGR